MTDFSLILDPYRGYGAAGRAALAGRVYRQPSHGRLFWRRFARRGIGGIDIVGIVGCVSARARSDSDGYFSLNWDGLDSLPTGWQPVDLDTPGHDVRPVRPAEIHFRPAGSRHIVISDIDDTVMVTGVANKLTMYCRMFFQGHEERSAFSGVPGFYEALRDGVSGSDDNPVLFVSRGPWSLYDLLERFFADRGIAEKPILQLREWGLTLQRPLPLRARDHKRALTAAILDMYGEADYVLIGDTGQRDAELYAGIVRACPGRIRAVYLRDVGAGAGRRAEIEGLYTGILQPVVTADTAEMHRHAAAQGLILPLSAGAGDPAR